MQRTQRGDTIIEVMFAFVIFSMVVVGAVMLMNRGVGMAQRSLEITQVRQRIDAQVLMIKHTQMYDPAGWAEVLGRLSPSVPSFTSTNECPNGADITKGFFVAQAHDSAVTNIYGGQGANVIKVYPIDSTNFSQAVTYSQVDYYGNGMPGPHAYGLWAQIVPSEELTAGGGKAYDLHVRACWGSGGSLAPATIGTVTRMYDGRNP